jgi:lipoprotein-anchoring transpeptidase ErfK/SrfK
LLAIGGASLVTLLTIGGALGLGPGAAMGETKKDSDRALQSSSAADQDAATPDSGASGSDDSSSDWLTIDEAPKDAEDSPSEADPAVPARSGNGKRIVFDMSDQRVWLVDDSGAVERTYLVSGSLHDNLQPGTYAVFSKSMDALSFNNDETMKYMVRFAHGENAAIGFHDVPRDGDGDLVQTKADLGEPQSAGCIRQWVNDAKALWRFADVDTKVVVTA